MRINEFSGGHFVLSLTDRNNRWGGVNCDDHEMATKAEKCVARAQQIAAHDQANRPRISNG